MDAFIILSTTKIELLSYFHHYLYVFLHPRSHCLSTSSQNFFPYSLPYLSSWALGSRSGRVRANSHSGEVEFQKDVYYHSKLPHKPCKIPHCLRNQVSVPQQGTSWSFLLSLISNSALFLPREANCPCLILARTFAWVVSFTYIALPLCSQASWKSAQTSASGSNVLFPQMLFLVTLILNLFTNVHEFLHSV